MSNFRITRHGDHDRALDLRNGEWYFMAHEQDPDESHAEARLNYELTRAFRDYRRRNPAPNLLAELEQQFTK